MAEPWFPGSESRSKISLLLVHSPLLGPSSWQPLAAQATRRSIPAVAPDLRDTVTLGGRGPGRFSRAAAEAADALPPPIVVIGHSGAGALLPEVGRGLGSRLGSLVFVDAVLPPLRGVYTPAPPVQELLDRHTSDGVLLPWLDWWPSHVVDELLPSAADRAALRADMPCVPRSFYFAPMPVPEGWADWPCGYLQLSAAYDAEYEVARGRGWSLARIDGDHLGIYTQPEAVLDALRTMLRTLGV